MCPGKTRRVKLDSFATCSVLQATLEAALWAFHQSESFRDGALLAVKLGDDADTTGAVYSQLAGPYYGVSAIPPAWREKGTHHGLIDRLADQLLVVSQSTSCER